jgi:hypothetical protein
VELGHLYGLAYAESSVASHSGPSGLRYSYTIVEDGNNVETRVHVGADTPSPRAIFVACMGYIPSLLPVAINFCGLQSEFDERFDALHGRMPAVADLGAEEESRGATAG